MPAVHPLRYRRQQLVYDIFQLNADYGEGKLQTEFNSKQPWVVVDSSLKQPPGLLRLCGYWVVYVHCLFLNGDVHIIGKWRKRFGAQDCRMTSDTRALL